MRTSKPFSTISYNSRDFLTFKLVELTRSGALDFWVYVEHYAEEDELKDHKHLYLVPSRCLDTARLLAELLEPDPDKPDKPLACLPAQSSKFGDWYLYACHDRAYLASKGQSRLHHYLFQDFVSSSDDYLLELTHHIDYSRFERFNELRDSALSGVPFAELVQNGRIPIPQIAAYQKAYSLILESNTYRAARQSHTPLGDGVLVDPFTGEVVLSENTLVTPSEPVKAPENRFSKNS